MEKIRNFLIIIVVGSIFSSIALLYSVFVYALIHTKVKNSYSNNIINLGSEIELNTVVLIKRLADSQITNIKGFRAAS